MMSGCGDPYVIFPGPLRVLNGASKSTYTYAVAVCHTLTFTLFRDKDEILRRSRRSSLTIPFPPFCTVMLLP